MEGEASQAVLMNEFLKKHISNLESIKSFPFLTKTIASKEDRIMKAKLIPLAGILLLVLSGCAQTSHFGVPDRALYVPVEFNQAEAAIADAEKSQGAKYCPEKIESARTLGQKAAELYWACHTSKAMLLLAKANELAKEAESCQAPAPVTATTPPPPPAPEPVPATPPPPPPKQAISHHSGYFEFDKSELTPATMAELDQVARIMQENPAAVLELHGHTDSVGNAAYNQALSDRRAEAVFDYLKSKGINPDRLKKMSFGASRPVASNETDEGRTRNRRVDIVIVK